jgi:hypothetical protein
VKFVVNEENGLESMGMFGKLDYNIKSPLIDILVESEATLEKTNTLSTEASTHLEYLIFI